MKKIVLTSLLAMLVSSVASAETNYFIGGAAAVVTNNDHSTVLAVAPEFGWKYNSDWDFGIAANFGYDHKYLVNRYGLDGKSYEYGAGVFARYKVAQFGGVKLLLKGSVGADFTTLSPDDSAIDSETLTSINANIIPMITYDVSESFTLYANLNFLGVGAGYTFGDKKNVMLDKTDSWQYGAIVDADDVANTGNFQIGFSYNF